MCICIQTFLIISSYHCNRHLLGIYVENESAGKFEIAGLSGLGSYTPEKDEPEFYNNRINDGSDLSIVEAVNNTGSKWVKEGTVESAEHFVNITLPSINDDVPIASPNKKKKSSPTSVVKGVRSSSGSITSKNLQKNVDSLSVDDADATAKVCPDRIYSVACHPSPDHLVVCAGDKKGYLGIWNVDQYGNKQGGSGGTDGVHLFKPHTACVSTLAWNQSGTSLLSSSYDGTVRLFDVNKQVFEEVFATYSDDDKYKDKVGFDTDNGYNSWIQSMEIDKRYESGKCFFLSTSEGGVMHIDMRAKSKVTFDQVLSNRKINTVSLHPNGHTMVTGGLSTTVQLWDVRKVPSFNKKSAKLPKSMAWQEAGRSINSAYFSPNGKRLLTTTQSNKLDILEDAHLATGLTQPKTSIRHDNQTGRWLSTFMAKWHPSSFSDRELFVVGSMKKPRCIEIFDDKAELLKEIRGEALTAVASRCCFHPTSNKLIVVGGNSSGRVTVAR